MAFPLAIFLLAGCFDDSADQSDRAAEVIKPVEWYKSHEPKREEMLKYCADNPGQLEETPNCKNALEAEQQLSSGSLKQLDNW